MPKLLLVDGTNYLFRAYHALPPLTTSKGEASGAIKGFNGMMNSLLTTVAPDARVCVFDASGPTFRHEIYTEYKANRPPMPEDLRSQIEPVQQLAALLGWHVIVQPGIEADDVIGTLAGKAAKEGWNVLIATGDKDMAQLVNDRVNLINTMNNTVLDSAGVKEKYGVLPERIIDYLALMGDKVDNVPGIDKCGPKRAAALIEEFGSLEGVIENAGSVKGKFGESLRAGLDFLPTARKLVTIKTDADIDFDATLFAGGEPQAEGLAAFYDRFEIRSGRAAAAKKAVPVAAKKKPQMQEPAFVLQADLFGVAPQTETVEAVLEDVSVAVSAEDLLKLSERLNAAKDARLGAGIWVCGAKSDYMTQLPSGFAVAVTPLDVVYVPLAHETGPNASAEDVKRFLGTWFSSEAPKLFYDAKHALHLLKNAGIDVQGRIDDLMLMSYVFDSQSRHDFSRIAQRTVAAAVPDDDAFYGKGASAKPASSMGITETAVFAGRNAAVLRAAAARLLTKIAADAKLQDIYSNLEMPLMRVLFKMERTGVLIDSKRLAEQSARLSAEIDASLARIEELAGEPMNPSSPKQIAKILFEKMGLPVKKKTPSGAPSTDEEVLTELSYDYPLPKAILEYRAQSKLKSTYTDKLPAMADREGRVHTTFGQATAVTGRLASSEPNLQNIPVRTPEGRNVREAFVAAPGFKIISADYSQIELRVMAHISGDEGLIEAFRQGRDIHRATAAEVFGKSLEAVSPDERRMAKVINFGLIYGMSAFGLAQNLGIARNVASHYIDEYFARYPAVGRYMQQTRAQAHDDGFVSTVFGRRLRLPDINAGRPNVRAAAERAAINAPMQGTAADLIKMAMIACDRWLTDNKLKSRLVLQVHDELIVEAPEDEVELVRENLPRIMAGVAKLKVPLVADVGVADNWEEAH